MKIVVNEKSLKEAIEILLKESRSIQSTRIDTIAGDVGEDDTTIGSADEPISASPLMSTQLSADRPPVEDPDFIPTNTQQLSRAASAIGVEVPDDQISWFYRRLHDLLDQALDRDDAPDYPEPTLEDEQADAADLELEDAPESDSEQASRDGAIFESRIKKAISMILEQDESDEEEEEDEEETPEEEALGDEYIDTNLTKKVERLGDEVFHFSIDKIIEWIHAGAGSDGRRSIESNYPYIFDGPNLSASTVASILEGPLSSRAQQVADETGHRLDGLPLRVLRYFKENGFKEYEDQWPTPEEVAQLDVTAEMGIELKKKRADLSPEDYVTYLLGRAKKEKDPQRRKAYEILADLAEKKARSSERQYERSGGVEEELTPEQQAQAYMVKAERDAKRLDALAPYFGFKNASGIRQWRMKFAEPKFKAMIGSATGIPAYKDYYVQVQDNLQILATKLADLTERQLENYKRADDLTPDEKEIMEGISMLNDEFQHMVSVSQESEEGYLPTNMLEGTTAGRLLRIAFKNMYYDRQFVEFAREMKKHIVKFLKESGIDESAANVFGKMFNGEVAIVPLNSDSRSAQKLRDGGITREIYEAAIAEEQKFIKDFFGDLKEDNQKYLDRISDHKTIVKVFNDALPELAKWSEMEGGLDKKLSEPFEAKEKIEESFKNIIRSMLRK